MDPSITPTSWRSRPAWRIQGDTLTAVLTATGGHLAAVYQTDDPTALNPLWQPHWQTGDPLNAAVAGTWGDGPEAALLTNIVGSNLCCDRFGAPHPGEDRPLHGEGGVTVWELSASGRGTATLSAVLPLAGLRVTRTVSLAGSQLTLTTTVHSDPAAGAVRPIEWCEHTTLGGDFLNGVLISAGMDACRDMEAPDVPVDVSAALSMPAVGDPPAGSVRTCRVADGAWSSVNARLGWRFSAAFHRDEFPWLCLWTEHRWVHACPLFVCV